MAARPAATNHRRYLCRDFNLPGAIPLSQVFYNPSPFAVIADEYIDQFVRSTPLLVIPLVMPTNMDLLYGIYAAFFYGYGIYLHWGFESDLLPADHPIMNTSFQHYAHHAISIKNKPYHTGFFFKVRRRSQS